MTVAIRALLSIILPSVLLPLGTALAAPPTIARPPRNEAGGGADFTSRGPIFFAGYRGALEAAAATLEAANDVAGAEAVWRDGVGKAPSDEVVLATEGFADFLIRRRRYAEAVELYRGLIKALPPGDFGGIAYLAVIARIQFIAGDSKTANSTLDQIVTQIDALPPDDMMAGGEITRIFEEAGRYKQAETFHRRALAAFGRATAAIPQTGELSTGTDYLRLQLFQNILLQRRDDPDVLPGLRRLVATWRTRQNAMLGQPMQGFTEIGTRGEGREVLGTLAAADWVAAQAGDRLGGALQAEAFGALQEMMCDQATQALVQAAARKSAQLEAGLGDLVGKRQALADHWLELFNARSMLLASGGSALAALPNLDRQRDAASAGFGEIDRVIGQKFPRFFAMIHPRALSAAEAQALLAPDEAVLVIVPSRYGTSLIVVTREGVLWKVSDLTERGVDAMVARLRQHLDVKTAAKGGLPSFDSRTAYALYAALIAPIKAAIGAKTHLFIAADGDLATLPFGVLVAQPPVSDADTSDPGVLQKLPWFADAQAIIQIPSLQSLAFLRGEKHPSGKRGIGAEFAGYGDPGLSGSAAQRGGAELPAQDPALLVGEGATEFGAPLMDADRLRKLHRLPGTRTELLSIQTALGAPPAALHLQAAMTEHAIKADSSSGNLSRTRIVDIATHGLTAGESGARAEPGLVFTPPRQASSDDDGYLSASEVVGLDLSGSEWVILSACNSAAPSGLANPGLSGLVRSFFFAGAVDLLVSHWPVFDSVAAELIASSLRHAGQPGVSRAQALQAAMQELRANRLYAHPSAWAPFSLIGDR